MNRMNIYLYLVVVAVAIVAGGTACRKSQEAVCRDLERKITLISLAQEMNSQTMAMQCQEMCREISSLDREERDKALMFCANKFLEIKLDAPSYDKRLAAIDKYLSIVRMTFDTLAVSVDDPDVLWNFRLNTLQKLNHELENCETDIDIKKHEHRPTGNLITRYWYRELLRNRRFCAIRDGFETGPFSVYYNDLADEVKAVWLSKIKAVAGRDVVIYDPQRPFVPQPRYEPSDEREWVSPSGLKGSREYIERLEDGTTIKMREVRK